MFCCVVPLIWWQTPRVWLTEHRSLGEDRAGESRGAEGRCLDKSGDVCRAWKSSPRVLKMAGWVLTHCYLIFGSLLSQGVVSSLTHLGNISRACESHCLLSWTLCLPLLPWVLCLTGSRWSFSQVSPLPRGLPQPSCVLCTLHPSPSCHFSHWNEWWLFWGFFCGFFFF